MYRMVYRMVFFYTFCLSVVSLARCLARICITYLVGSHLPGAELPPPGTNMGLRAGESNDGGVRKALVCRELWRTVGTRLSALLLAAAKAGELPHTLPYSRTAPAHHPVPGFTGLGTPVSLAPLDFLLVVE